MTTMTPHPAASCRRLPGDPRTPLTHRQVEILRLVANGGTNAAIGRRLGITADTVNESVRKSCRKLGAVDRAHAVALALVSGVLTPADITRSVRDAAA